MVKDKKTLEEVASYKPVTRNYDSVLICIPFGQRNRVDLFYGFLLIRAEVLIGNSVLVQGLFFPEIIDSIEYDIHRF